MRSPVTVALRARNLTLVRGGRTVVEDLEWEVRPGSVARVTGGNGSGKSTLLGAMAGRVAPTSGRVQGGGPSGPGGRGIVWYHPVMEPPPEVRVRDWLRLAGALAPRRPGPSLAPQLPPDRTLGALSTGERKRLVLQALLDRRAGAYVLDEPFEHLSSDAALTLAARLEAMARNAVVVVATHRELTIAGDGARGAAVLRLLGGGSWHLEEAPRPDPS